MLSYSPEERLCRSMFSRGAVGKGGRTFAAAQDHARALVFLDRFHGGKRCGWPL